MALDDLGRIDLTAVMVLGRLRDEFQVIGVAVEPCAVPSQPRSLIDSYEAHRKMLEVRG